jgi:hypothetical protein
MPNLFDYLKWRGDLRFHMDGFNEVDNLIFASLSYIDFEDVVPCTPDRAVTLAQAVRQLKEADRLTPKGLFLQPYPELLVRAAEADRFKDVLLTCYISRMDETIPNQFAAVIFSIGARAHYIAYRGTDDNLAGWKEDFLMSFKDAVLAQKQAAAYLNKYAPRLPGRVYVGGHSKGGNLAVFAASHTAERLRKKIAAVYNNDGPGFQTPLLQSEGYAKIENRIQTIIPKSSVIGLLLEHGADYKIVASSENGMLSHNPLTWGVSGTSFVHETELSKSSRTTNEALRAWLGTLTLPQREQFTEALFEVISATGAQTLSDLTKERLLLVDAMLKKYRSLDRDTRKLLRDTVINFFSVRQKILRESLGQSFEALLGKKT